MYQRRTCDHARGETEACDLKTRDGTTGEVSWKSASVKNEKKLEKTNDQDESDETDAKASQHDRSFCAETMSENASEVYSGKNQTTGTKR